MRARWTTWTVIALTSLAGAGAAAEVKGTFNLAGTEFQVRDGIAYEATGEEGKPVTIVVVTDVELDDQAILDEIDPLTSIYEQVNEGQGNLVTAALNAPESCYISAYLSETSHHVGLGDFPTKMETAGGTVSGRCATVEPVKSFDNTYEFDFEVDLPLTKIEQPEEVGEGGGEAGQALLALLDAIDKQDIEVARRHVQLKPDGTVPADDEISFKGLAMNYPHDTVVVGGIVKDDRARLEIKGKDEDGKKLKGTFDMRKIDGNWRVHRNSLFFDWD